MNTLTAPATELTIVRCWCGIQHAIPTTLRETQLKARDRGGEHAVYCPLGHRYIATGTSETKILEDKLARERARHDQTRAELRETEARRRGEKAAKTRLKNRVAKGVCPCCNRSFVNLRRHMEGQHPEYVQGGG